MTGIYKITSPTGKIYIGQSVDLKSRLNGYLSEQKKIEAQVRLHYSFKKHKVHNHTFDIIEECSIENLNERERYWQDLYDATGKNGLNCLLTKTDTKSGKTSKETRLKMSEAKKGKKLTKEHIRKLNLHKIGRRLSNETKTKISQSHKNIPQEMKTYWGKKSTGWKHSNKTKELLSINNKKKKLVIDLNTGFFYESLTELCELYDFNKVSLSEQLRGRLKNRTNYIYV